MSATLLGAPMSQCSNSKERALARAPSRLPTTGSSSGLAAAVVAAVVALVGASCDGAINPGRTVLMISIDTARADAITFEDTRTTPNLAGLADRGVVFDQAISGSSWTLPAHVQMFTGQPPAVHGVNFDDVRIDPNTPMLAELFEEAGWYTAGYFSGWYLVKDYGFNRGFAIYENAMPGGSRFERELREAEKIADDKSRAAEMAKIWDRADTVSHQAISSPTVADKALDAISNAGEKDLFLFLHFFDPHYDYVPPTDIAKKFDPGYTGSIDGKNFYGNKQIYDPFNGGRKISPRDLEHIKALYQGEINWTDQNIGVVLEALDKAGRLDSAFVAVVGDHGEEFFEHDGRGHRNTLFDEQLRVPMLIVPPRGDNAPTGRHVATQTSLSDIAPTLLEYAGLQRGHCFGTSLLPALKGADLPARAQYSLLREFPRVPFKDATRVTHVFIDSWRRPDLKLQRGWMYEAWSGQFRFSDVALFDLATDPLEKLPIKDINDPRFVEAWSGIETLKSQMRSAQAVLGQAEAEERISSAADMMKGILGQLGYLDDGSSGSDGSGAEASYEVPWKLSTPPELSLELLRAQVEKR